MRPVRFFVLSGLLLATVPGPAAAGFGPAVSLQQLLRDNDCEAVPELLGDWTTDGDLSGTWTVQTLRDRNYRLIQNVRGSDNSNRDAFDICVAHLGGYLFFDATFQVVLPDGKKTLLGEDDVPFWIPLHLIGRLEIEYDALHFRLLDDGWLQDAQKSGRVHLTCSQDYEGTYLLTAPSKELKQFAAQFARDPEAFSYTEDFVRAPDEETEHRHSDAIPKKKDHRGPVLGEGRSQSSAELAMKRSACSCAVAARPCSIKKRDDKRPRARLEVKTSPARPISSDPRRHSAKVYPRKPLSPGSLPLLHILVLLKIRIVKPLTFCYIK